MNRKFTSIKKLVLTFTLLASAFSVYAGAGFWEDNSATVNFSTGSVTVKMNNQGEQSLGTVTSLKLSSFRTNTWKKDGGNICEGVFHYAVYKQGSQASTWRTVPSVWKSESQNGDAVNQVWGGDNINDDLLNGLDKGDCVFEFYITHPGNDNSGGCDKEYTLNNGGPNYIVKFNNNSTGGDCDVKARGVNIPANTVIFFDNSDGAIPGGAVYLSVPTESGNGNATSLNYGSYIPSKDKWYTMTNLGNGIWRAVITNASSYGRMSFWAGDLSSHDAPWQTTVAFQIPYQSGFNTFKAEKTNCYNDERQTTYYTKGSWTNRQSLDLVASAYSIKEGDTTPIILTAMPVGIPSSNFTFEYKTFDSDQWQTLAVQSSTTYTLSGAKLPSKTTYYRVSCGTSYTSDAIRIAVIMQCKKESSKTLIKYDFGTFTSLKGAGSRRSESGMAPDYIYQPYPYKINDGYYAVVATPRYCGCGDGKNMSESVESCEGNNMWFRDLGDHSNPTHSGTEYGGMLFINFDQNKSKTAFKQILEDEEKNHFVKGSTLTFSAWFASATVENPSGGTNIPINMKLSIEYKPAGSGEDAWVTKASLATQVSYDDEWEQGVTSIDIDDVDGDYRVIIENNAASGTGNDVLIDDISLDLCIPDFNVEFFNPTTGSTYTEYTFEDIDVHVEHIRIPKKDYGFGDKNTVLLVAVDESKEIGQPGRFKYLGEMENNTDPNYYITTRTATELLNQVYATPDYTGKLQVIITEYGTVLDTFVPMLENGTITPFPVGDTSVLSSTNMLTYTVNCKPAITAQLSSTTPVCELSGKKEGDMPTLNVTFDHISSKVDYSLFLDGNTSLVTYAVVSPDEVAAGAFSIPLERYESNIRTAGTHTLTVMIHEFMFETLICEKTAPAVSIVVKEQPSYNTNLWVETVDYCLQKYLEVNAQYTTSYSWYVDKGENPTAENWELIPGANSARYDLPVDLKDGWRYKVELGNDYCTTVTTLPVVVNRIASDAPEADNYIECAVKTGGELMPLADLVSPQYTLLTWYQADKTTVVTDPRFNTGVSTEKPVIYYVTDTRASGCESEPAVVIVHVKPNAANPVAVTPYFNECLDEGRVEIDLNKLFNYNADLAYRYYSDEGALNSSIVVIDEPGTNLYYVEAILDGCVSDQTQIPVTVKNNATADDIDVDAITACKGASAEFNATTKTVLPSPVFNWYSDAELKNKVATGANYKFTADGDKVFYVTVQNAKYCENVPGDAAEAEITMIIPVTSMKLTPEEESIRLGDQTEKTLVIEPADAEYKSVEWTANDESFDPTTFPVTPYLTQTYKVVLVDICDTKHEASASTDVEWPTVFMPYDNSSTNMDFVTGVEGGIELIIFDRSGNMVAHTYDGWDGTVRDGRMAMPDVYYYKAILPDGNTKLGTVEILKK